jgi:hypothetical protein
MSKTKKKENIIRQVIHFSFPAEVLIDLFAYVRFKLQQLDD